MLQLCQDGIIEVRLARVDTTPLDAVLNTLTIDRMETGPINASEAN